MRTTLAVIIAAMVVGVRFSSGFTFDEDAKRHYIYWDPKITKIIKDPNFSLKVEMGHFMDIVCPLSNLGLTENPSPPILFDLYNVTEDGFKKCDPTGGRLIFACSLPDQENKLTIKFQSISPSPFGFRFQECAEYYFLAVKRPSPLNGVKGVAQHHCTEESERLRIKVGCSHENDDELEAKTSTTTVPTTTRKTTTSFLDRVKSEAENRKGTEPVVIPDLHPVDKNPAKDSGKLPPRSDPQQSNGDGNGASRTAHYNIFSTSICVVLSLVLYFIQFTSS